MRYSLLLGMAVAALCSEQAFAQSDAATRSTSTATSIRRFVAPESGSQDTPLPPSLPSVDPTPLNLRSGATFTGIHGFYDYQSNGMLRGRMMIPHNAPDKIYTAAMVATDGTDSATVTASRRVAFAFSSDGGKTWNSNNDIGSGFRLGYPYLAIAADGTPYAAVHGDPDHLGSRTMIYSGTAGSTEFTKSSTFERLSILGSSGDDGSGVIWPGFVINPKDPTKQVVVATLGPKTTPIRQPDEPIHFAVSALGGKATWNAFSLEDQSTSSGGRNILATSPAGKIGMVYYHSDSATQPGIYLSESNDGGATWGIPVRAIPGDTVINVDNEDTLGFNGTVDFVYNGEEPQIVIDESLNNKYVSTGISYWSASKGLKRIALTDTTIGLGIATTPAIQNADGALMAVKTQPNMGSLCYPSLSVGDDGKHIVVCFAAAGENGDAKFLSPEGFFYYRIWAVGSPDGGATWNTPRILQDFASEGSDSATIEYPAASDMGRMVNGNFEHSMIFQAKRFPGMYAFVVTDVDPSPDVEQPADRGPINETYQYYQKTSLDPPFFGLPASVETKIDYASGMSITRSFPNPASTAISVDYRLATSGAVTVKVFNTLGVEMLRLVDGDVGYAGDYSRSFDISSLPAGSYRLVVTQNNHSVSHPLNVVR